ncbi:PIN domain-containing protein [Butyrivibrio sp. MC2013]|uniref:PIN domain-containing protein n=1 Tax=Butyrivibrio sp. MC2013 TaxID=1280686 RepID=UPI001FA7F64D|nr:PIN domain-containing protein [Butyrivibrio sp. MC2013]
MDTNVIIHLYRGGHQNILFELFDEGVFIYEQIRSIELENHGKDILNSLDNDIRSGKLEIYSDQKLKDMAVFKIFENNVKENRYLYGPGDLCEVYAISLAQTLGAYSLVTNDTKQGGPYMSLLQFEDDIMPFTFADLLIIRFLIGQADENQTVRAFDDINSASDLNWSFRSQLSKFIRRFFIDPYRKEDTVWIKSLAKKYDIKIKTKLQILRDAIDM